MNCLNTLTKYLLYLLLCVSYGIQANENFTAQELAIIKRFGPWPPTYQSDPSNQLAGQALAIQLGQQLFFDPKLSLNQSIACASCHQPNHDFSDKRSLAQGLTLGLRNIPTLWNANLKHWYGWGGSIDTLWGASLNALLHPREMAMTASKLIAYLQSQPEHLNSLQQIPAWQKAQSTEAKLVVIGKLLAAYQAQLISPKSEFDRFREALLRNDKHKIKQYSAAKQRGLKLFIGKGNCRVCHSGPLFSNNEFSDIGLPYFDHEGNIDKGRYQGIKALRASPFSSLGRYNDDTSGNSQIRAKHLILTHRNFGEFKVPSLRQVAHTPPYMHQGSLATLAEVVDHYSNLDEARLHTDGVAILTPLKLTEREKADLIAFLESL